MSPVYLNDDQMFNNHWKSEESTVSDEDKELLLDYIDPPKENRKEAWMLLLRIKDLSPTLFHLWLIDAKGGRP